MSSAAIKRLRLLSPVPRDSEQLQISKDSRVVENQLNEKLITIVKQLQKLQMQPIDIYNIDFREKVQTTLRHSIERIYQIAGNYAAEFTRKEYYTTKTDLATIERLSLTYGDIFFSRLGRFIIPSNQVQQEQDQQKNQVRPEFIVTMTTANLTQDTMRQAIITKSQQVLNKVAITTAAFSDNSEDIAINDTILNPVVYVWVTSQDDKVCPICSRYEGQAWPYEDSADIPDIPDDTHPNCRCMLQLSEAEFLS